MLVGQGLDRMEPEELVDTDESLRLEEINLDEC